MGWEEQVFALFDDLEGQASAAYERERAAELVDRSRAEYHAVSLDSRLVASLGTDIGVEVLGIGRIDGELQRVGTGWFLLSGRGQDWVVRTAAVRLLHQASARSVAEVAWSPLQKLGLGSALRRLADSGVRCLVRTVDGDEYDAVVTRVGADFVEFRSPRGADQLAPFAALAAVQSRD